MMLWPPLVGSEYGLKHFSCHFCSAASVSLNLRASIPLADLNSRITISAPFVFDFPVQSERGATDYFGLGDFATGRSFSGGEATRMAMYKEVETYVSRLLGADGHSCLLRAMCETSANPLHDDGILGTVLTSLSRTVLMVEGLCFALEFFCSTME